MSQAEKIEPESGSRSSPVVDGLLKIFTSLAPPVLHRVRNQKFWLWLALMLMVLCLAKRRFLKVFARLIKGQ